VDAARICLVALKQFLCWAQGAIFTNGVVPGDAVGFSAQGAGSCTKSSYYDF
jgi:hypothetical protein